MSQTPKAMTLTPAAIQAIGDINSLLNRAVETALSVEDPRDRALVLTHLARIMSSSDKADGVPLVSQVWRARESVFRSLLADRDNPMRVEDLGALVAMSKQAVSRCLNAPEIKAARRSAAQAKRAAQEAEPATLADAA